jgi:glycine cleavage system H protein
MNKDLPTNLLYNNDYSWVKIEGDVATLGITKTACDKVQEFVFVKLPEKSQQIKKGETYVSLEAIKWSGHLSSPLSGEVVEVNEDIFDEPSMINEDPYGKGWIAKIKMKDISEKDDLIEASAVKDD